MFKVTFTGFETAEQAKTFAQWYSGAGEQDSEMWMTEHSSARFVGVQSIKPGDDNEVVVEVKIRPKDS